VRAHERRQIDLARLAPFVIAIALSGLFLWLRPNMNAAASAARFEDLIAQNAPELLPRESFVAYEHLRKYYQSTGEAEKNMRVLRSMAETKHLALESYRRVFIALANARHSEARARDFAWLLARLVDDARHFGQLRPKDIGDARDFDEFATRVFIGATQAGYPELARRYQPQFEAARPAWTGAGLVRAGDAALPAAEAVALLRASVTDSTRDAELLIIAAGVYQQRGMDDEAIAHVERAIARQPVYYPKWYLALAGMYHQKGRAAEEADVLRRCVANCPGTPEAEEARRLLDEAASFAR
jgi:tetratricopeptide (TPR) repeat protein